MEKTMDGYISEFPEPVQEKLQMIRSLIKKLVPEAVEKISYGIPTFTLKTNLIHFGAFKTHIGLYALPHTNEVLKEELKKYRTSKGTVQFPLDIELPLDLIEKIVRQRLKENK